MDHAGENGVQHMLVQRWKLIVIKQQLQVTILLQI